MQITVELPDDFTGHPDPGREALQALAIEGYRSEKFTHHQAAQLLSLTRFEFDGFSLAQRPRLRATSEEKNLLALSGGALDTAAALRVLLRNRQIDDHACSVEDLERHKADLNKLRAKDLLDLSGPLAHRDYRLLARWAF